MTDYAAIGNAIKATFLADPWLGNPVNVKTIETFKRGFEIQAQKEARYFDKDYLPAIAIIPSSAPKTSDQTTTNEIISVVKPEVIGLVYARGAQDADALIHALAGNIERVLEKQKTSAQNLGIDAFVLDVATAFEEYKDGEFYLMISTTTCDVEITNTF